MKDTSITTKNNFTLMGINHQFNHEFAWFNSVCRAFVYNAYQQKKIFSKAYDEKVHNFDDVYSIGIDLLYARLADSIDLALTVIKEIRDVDITPKEFFNISTREGNINISKYLQPINEAKKTIDTVIEEIADYRKKERALQDLTKSKSNIGRGYDFAGWLLDGAINLAADAVRGAGHMYTDSKDRKKVEAYKLKLFQDTPIGNQPNMSAYLKDIVEPVCFEVFAAVRPIIGLYGVLYKEDFQNSANLINKVKSYRPVTPDEVVNGIFRYPYEVQLYEILFELNPNTYSELVTLAYYAGIDEKFHDLMSTKIVDWVKRGFNAKKAGEYQKALKYFTLASQAGSAEAMALVGSMYVRGEGVDQDDAKAQEWYSKSAELGNIEAMHVLGHLLLETSSHKDFKKSLSWFQKAADKGHSDSMLMLAKFYRNGTGVPVNSKLAMDWYPKAADTGNKDAAEQLAKYKDELLQIEENSLNDKQLLKRAQSAMNEKKTDIALRCYQKSADKGNLKAMLELAEIYEVGRIVKKDFNKLFELYLKAAEKGDIPSMVKVGEYYSNGRGVTKDLKKAHKFYEKSAEKGHFSAMLILAMKYENGSGVEKNLSMALKWYSKATNSDNRYTREHAQIKVFEIKQLIEQDAQKRATEKLRQLESMKVQNKIAQAKTSPNNLPDNSDTTQQSKSSANPSANDKKAKEFYELGLKYYNGDDVSNDFNIAWKYFNLAAQSGNIDAIYYIGLMHKFGKGVPKNDSLAVENFTTAANSGNIKAMNRLGSYYSIRDIQLDFKKSLQWFLKAAELGDSEAMCSIGRMYANGEGVEKDSSKEMEWYMRAAELGNASAMYYMAYNFDQGIGIEKNPIKAVEWYTRAAELGETVAMLCLGDMYAHGNGIPKDLEYAVYWYKRAFEAGDKRGAMSIGILYENKGNHALADEWFLKHNPNFIRKKPKDSSGCFITSAVYSSFGKSDDCYELTAFRNFRDTWLVNQTDGKGLIDEYYRIAPQIVSNISRSENSSTIYENIWKKYLAPCLSFIETDQNQSCKLLYIEMVNSLKKKYL